MNGSSLLTGAAQLAPRPPECAGVVGVWKSVGRDGLQAQCATLARGYAALSVEPQRSLMLAQGLAEGPLSRDAFVLEARALVAVGQYEQAARLFERAGQWGSDLLQGAGVQHDRAVAAAFTGDSELAAELYRALVPQLSLLQPRRRARVLLEAALAVMRLGPQHVEEARVLIDYADRVREYRQERAVWMLVRGLAESRAGMASDVELQDPDSLLTELAARGFDSALPAVPAPEVAALGAIAYDTTDAPRARELWREYATAELAKPWRRWVSERVGTVP